MTFALFSHAFLSLYFEVMFTLNLRCFLAYMKLFKLNY